MSETRAARDVIAERLRQIGTEGWTPEHDDEYPEGTLALAACCYAMPEKERKTLHSAGVSVWRALWPWGREWWKPKGRRHDLIRAAALLIAEIDRLDRAAEKPEAQSAASP